MNLQKRENRQRIAAKHAKNFGSHLKSKMIALAPSHIKEAEAEIINETLFFLFPLRPFLLILWPRRFHAFSRLFQQIALIPDFP